MLAEELPDSTFVEARGILEWRLRPERLNAITAEFVARCFDGCSRRRAASRAELTRTPLGMSGFASACAG